MDVVLKGHSAERPDDPLVMAPGSTLDHRMLEGPIGKQRREDLQMLSWLQTMTLSGALTHPISFGPGSDPPDRLLTTPTGSWSMELTEFTVEHFRARLARVRQVGRELASRIAAKPQQYSHLSGRQIHLSDVETEAGGSLAIRSLVENLAQLLLMDKGYVGEGIDTSDGLPDPWPNDRGFYGRIDPFMIQVQLADATQPASPPEVVASSPAQFSLSEIRQDFWKRVRNKDVAENSILLVTSGLVDSAGYRCPLDDWIFDALAEHGFGPFPEMQHLDSVLLHKFSTGACLVAYERNGAPLPWSS